jgi:uncharacterized glyoxalase superfamily protein PhnB
MPKSTFSKLTPVLFVEAVEPCLPFWTERLSFTIEVEVPHEDRIGFVILKHGSVEVMLQSRASLMGDVPAIVPPKFSPCTVLYIDVPNLNQVLKQIEEADIVVPARKTFYGAREVFVRAPGGHIVAFSQHAH